jgi:plastocyanin
MNARKLMKPWLLVAVVAVVAVLVLAACGGSSGASTSGSGGSTATTPAATSGTGSQVTIQNFAFTPQTLTVKPGTTVTWTNKDSVPHNLVSAVSLSTTAATTGLFTSGNLGQGQTFSYTFTKAGTYYYLCSLHISQPSMHAKIVVK